MSKRAVFLLLCLAASSGLLVAFAGPRASSWEHTSSPYHLSRLFTSMEGPGESRHDIKLAHSEDELVWLTGYQATMTDAGGKNRVSQEFMCHNTLILDGTVTEYRALLGTRPYGSPRIFTLAQGAYRIDFPDGFAIPIPGAQSLELHSQVLNLLPEHVGQEVRHRVRAEFVADKELWRKPRPLFLVEAAGRALVSDSRASAKAVKARGGKTYTDKQGRVLTAHWQVPPGSYTNVTQVGDQLALPFDTTVHCITSHLHPYAQWQELRDVTTGQLVHRIEARSSVDGRSLVEIPIYSSQQGLALWADHEYELVTHYNNTSGQTVTAMSNLFLYCLDKEFKDYDPPAGRPAPSPKGVAATRPFDEFCAPEMAPGESPQGRAK